MTDDQDRDYCELTISLADLSDLSDLSVQPQQPTFKHNSYYDKTPELKRRHLDRLKEKLPCKCGKMVTRSNMSKHLVSKQHAKHLEEIRIDKAYEKRTLQDFKIIEKEIDTALGFKTYETKRVTSGVIDKIDRQIEAHKKGIELIQKMVDLLEEKKELLMVSINSVKIPKKLLKTA